MVRPPPDSGARHPERGGEGDRGGVEGIEESSFDHQSGRHSSQQQLACDAPPFRKTCVRRDVGFPRASARFPCPSRDRKARHAKGKIGMELPTVARVSVGSTTRKVTPTRIGQAKFASTGIRDGTVSRIRSKSATLSHRANKVVAVAAGEVDASPAQQDSKQVRPRDPIVGAQYTDAASPMLESNRC